MEQVAMDCIGSIDIKIKELAIEDESDAIIVDGEGE